MLNDPTPRKAVEFAIETEAMGKLFYEKLADKFASDKDTRDIFLSMAKEEEVHERQFTALLENIPDEPVLKSRPEHLAVLRATSMSEFLLGERGLFKQLEDIKTPLDAVERAFKLERDTIGYYRAMQDVIGHNDILDAVIRAEQLHVADLLALMGPPEN